MKRTDAVFLGKCVRRATNGETLSAPEANRAFRTILQDDDTLSNFYWGALFSSLQARKPTYDEIVGFVEAASDFDSRICLDNSAKVEINTSKPVVAITGSGKDTCKTFNISTTAGFIAASCGVCVVKPGSPAVTAISGATQILPHLGIALVHDVQRAREIAEQTDLAIFGFADVVPRYAQRYDELFHHFHPLSYVMPVVAIPFKLDGVVFGIADENVELGLRLIRRFGPGEGRPKSTATIYGCFGAISIVIQSSLPMLRANPTNSMPSLEMSRRSTLPASPTMTSTRTKHCSTARFFLPRKRRVPPRALAGSSECQALSGPSTAPTPNAVSITVLSYSRRKNVALRAALNLTAAAKPLFGAISTRQVTSLSHITLSGDCLVQKENAAQRSRPRGESTSTTAILL